MNTETQLNQTKAAVAEQSPAAGAKPLTSLAPVHGPVYPAAGAKPVFRPQEVAGRFGRVQPRRSVDGGPVARAVREHARGRHSG